MIPHDVLVDNRPHRVKVLERNNSIFLVDVDEKTVTVEIKNPAREGTATIEFNGKPFQVKINRTQRSTLKVELGERTFEVRSQSRALQASTVKPEPVSIKRRPIVKLAIEKDAVTAPISGRIVLLKVNLGQRVDKGERVCVLEAMKMENEIVARKAGVVEEIRVSEGATVNKGDVLVVIK